MEKKQELTFILSGLLFMLLIAGIKYATQQTGSVIGLLAAFAFGGVVGIVGMTKKTSYLKNILFIATFTWLIWAAFTPIDTLGQNWVVNKPAIVLGLTIFIIFAETEFWNIFKKMRNKPSKAGLGILGTIMILILLNVTGLSEQLGLFIAQNILYLIIFLIIWWGILYVLISKQLNKLSTKLIEGLNRGR